MHISWDIYCITIQTATIVSSGSPRQYIYNNQSFQMDAFNLPWWRHQMETFSALLAICAGNSHGSKNRRIWPKLGVSGQQLQFEFTDGYEMLHKAWNSKGEVPYCFPRSSIKYQGHTGQNITDFDPNWAFPDYRPVAAFKSLRSALLINEKWFPVYKCFSATV